MTLPIISADERLKETKGIKGCIFGKSGIGKTSLLWTMPAETTLFFDLEAGDLAIEGWQGDTTCSTRAARTSGLSASSTRSWMTLTAVFTSRRLKAAKRGWSFLASLIR